MLMIICTQPNYVILNRLHLKLAHNCVCMSSCVSIGSDLTYQPHKTTSLVNFDESIWRPSEIRSWMDPTKVLTKDASPDGWSACKHPSRSALVRTTSPIPIPPFQFCKSEIDFIFAVAFFARILMSVVFSFSVFLCDANILKPIKFHKCFT